MLDALGHPPFPLKNLPGGSRLLGYVWCMGVCGGEVVPCLGLPTLGHLL